MYVKNSKGDTVPHFIVWQALIWDRFARISPILSITVIAIMYMIGFRNWELIIDTIIIMFAITAVTWWFWVVYTIAMIAYIIDKSSEKLKDVIYEIREIKEEVKTFDTPRPEN